MNTDKDNKNKHFQSETQNKVFLLSSCLPVLLSYSCLSVANILDFRYPL
jgi:hypothetical protein